MGTHDRARPLVVAVDLSTTASKALAVDSRGRLAASARVPITSSSPRPGWREQDADAWWTTLCEALRVVMSAVDPAAVRALCVTHQRETFVCLDEAGMPLRPAILWLDTRASAEVDELGSAQVHEISGRPPSTTPSFYKLAWLRTHEPRTMDRTAMVADVHAFIAHQLTGHWATSWASADAMGLVDIRSFAYSAPLLETVGLRPEQLPELVAPGAQLGVVTDAAAQESGLPAGVPVIAGAGDGQCSGLGAAVCSDGEAYLNLGTAVTLGVHSDEYTTALAFRTLASPIAGRWTLEAALASGVHSLDWFRRQVLDDMSPAALDRLEADATAVPPGADGLLFLPYLVRAETPHWDPAARGAWVGLRDHHGHGHLYRAVLEGIAFEQQLVLSMIEAETGTPVATLRVTGGGAGSTLWLQLFADILERPIQVSEHREATALGAAVLAASGAELEGERDVVATARRMAGNWHEIHPRPSTQDRYRRQALAYRELYPALADIFRRLED